MLQLLLIIPTIMIMEFIYYAIWNIKEKIVFKIMIENKLKKKIKFRDIK